MKPLFLSLFLSFFSFTVNSQILNGGFEDWEIDIDGHELPVSWSVGNTGYPNKIFKSTESYSGSHSMGIETNYGTITLGPVKIFTKVKPTAFNYHLSLQYKIDSLVNDGGINISVYQDDNMGGGNHITDTTILLLEEDFKELNLLFSLNSLDSIGITLEARNQEIDIGYIGYTRALFDAVELTPITSTHENGVKNSILLYPNPATGTFRIANLKAEHKKLKIINPLGRVVHEEIINSDIFYFKEEGVFFITLCDDEGKVLDIIKLINR